MRPFALTRGLRLSVEIASWRYALGVDHSHMVITTLRSTPCGRSGFATGSSPAAMRLVQSANNDSAFCGPNRLSVTPIFVLACPASRRCVQASMAARGVFPVGANSFGIVRTPLEPSAWQDWHEFLSVSIQ